MKASGLRSFEEVITTLIERDELIKKECKIYVTTKLRNGNKNRTLTVATFYKSKNGSDPSLEKHN
jgi:hypothetical protein